LVFEPLLLPCKRILIPIPESAYNLDAFIHHTMTDIFNSSAGAGTAQNEQGQTIGTFVASLAGSAAAFGAQILVFYLLKNKFTRI
jgi:hypothetical protein